MLWSSIRSILFLPILSFPANSCHKSGTSYWGEPPSTEEAELGYFCWLGFVFLVIDPSSSKLFASGNLFNFIVKDIVITPHHMLKLPQPGDCPARNGVVPVLVCSSEVLLERHNVLGLIQPTHDHLPKDFGILAHTFLASSHPSLYQVRGFLISQSRGQPNCSPDTVSGIQTARCMALRCALTSGGGAI